MADESARVLARFVRPIYDAIDSRQYKNAIKLCAHKKVAHLDIVQVLKAHCLERTGKVDEALVICRQVQKKNPTDDTLLNTMNLVFKLSGCEHEMLPTFEYACAHAEPPNEELFTSLFVAYARRGDFLKQQQTALKMYKAFNNIKYVCWAAISMMLQVEHGGAPPKMLNLAERMLLKTLRESKSNDGEALQLAVLILQLQGKNTDALQVFDEFVKFLDDDDTVATKENSQRSNGRASEGEGAYDEDIELGPMQAIDRLTLEASLAKQVSDSGRCASINRELLEKYNADDWAFLLEYINARFQQTDDLEALEKELTAFFTELQTRPGNEVLRGPVLAVIHVNSEILQRLHERKASADDVKKVEARLEELIAGYMDRFYSKTCCFTDLKQYVTLFLSTSTTFSNATKTKFITRVHTLYADSVSSESSKIEADDRKGSLNRLNRHILSLKMLRFLGYFHDQEKFSISDLEDLVKELVKEYELCSWLNEGGTGGQREVQPTDDLLLIAAHFLLDIYQRTPGRREILLQAAALLEYGLEKSAYNFQMKLLLCRVYAYMSACEVMLSRHTELDVKYVQLDSLSFLVLDKLLALCHYPEARRLCDSINRLHRMTGNDTPEYISRAYRLGVYSKVLDMTSFLYKRMEKSHTLAISRSESLQFTIMDALTSGPSKLHEHLGSEKVLKDVEALEKMLLSEENLSQNQHREVVVRWTAQQQIANGDAFAEDDAPLIECDRSAHLSSSLLWLKLRTVECRLLRAIALGDNDKLATLEQSYRAHLSQLNLISASSTDDSKQLALNLQKQVWKWCSGVVSEVVKLSQPDADLESLPHALADLQTMLVGITEQIPGALTFGSSDQSGGDAISFSSFGVSVMSLLLHECGLLVLSLSSLAIRALAKKKGKKDERQLACANALRSFLKQMQESFASLDNQINALSFASTVPPLLLTGKSTNLDLAAQKAQQNVQKSYKDLQIRLRELLQERVAIIRAILQK